MTCGMIVAWGVKIALGVKYEMLTYPGISLVKLDQARDRLIWSGLILCHPKQPKRTKAANYRGLCDSRI